MFRQHVRPPCLLSIALVIAVPVCLIYVLQLLFPDVSDTMPPSPMAPPSRGTHRLFVGVLIVLGCAMVFVMMRTLLDAAAPSEERRRTSKVRPSFIARRSATSLADEPLLPSPKLALALLQERNQFASFAGVPPPACPPSPPPPPKCLAYEMASASASASARQATVDVAAVASSTSSSSLPPTPPPSDRRESVSRLDMLRMIQVAAESTSGVASAAASGFHNAGSTASTALPVNVSTAQSTPPGSFSPMRSEPPSPMAIGPAAQSSPAEGTHAKCIVDEQPSPAPPTPMTPQAPKAMESPQAVNLQSSGEDGNAQRAVLLANATARDAWTILNDLRGSDGSDELSAGSGDLSKRAQNGGVDRGFGAETMAEVAAEADGQAACTVASGAIDESSSDEADDAFNAVAFWRQPIGPPPELPTVPKPMPTPSIPPPISVDQPSTVSLSQSLAGSPMPPPTLLHAAPPAPDDDDDDDESSKEFNAMTFWRSPVGPPPASIFGTEEPSSSSQQSAYISSVSSARGRELPSTPEKDPTEGASVTPAEVSPAEAAPAEAKPAEAKPAVAGSAEVAPAKAVPPSTPVLDPALDMVPSPSVVWTVAEWRKRQTPTEATVSSANESVGNSQVIEEQPLSDALPSQPTANAKFDEPRSPASTGAQTSVAEDVAAYHCRALATDSPSGSADESSARAFPSPRAPPHLQVPSTPTSSAAKRAVSESLRTSDRPAGGIQSGVASLSVPALASPSAAPLKPSQSVPAPASPSAAPLTPSQGVFLATLISEEAGSAIAGKASRETVHWTREPVWSTSLLPSRTSPLSPLEHKAGNAPPRQDLQGVPQSLRTGTGGPRPPADFLTSLILAESEQATAFELGLAAATFIAAHPPSASQLIGNVGARLDSVSLPSSKRQRPSVERKAEAAAAAAAEAAATAVAEAAAAAAATIMAAAEGAEKEAVKEAKTATLQTEEKALVQTEEEGAVTSIADAVQTTDKARNPVSSAGDAGSAPAQPPSILVWPGNASSFFVTHATWPASAPPFVSNGVFEGLPSASEFQAMVQHAVRAAEEEERQAQAAMDVVQSKGAMGSNAHEGYHLPEGWSAEVDPSTGVTYYIDLANATSQWELPDAPTVAGSAAAQAPAADAPELPAEDAMDARPLELLHEVRTPAPFDPLQRQAAEDMVAAAVSAAVEEFEAAEAADFAMPANGVGVSTVANLGLRGEEGRTSSCSGVGSEDAEDLLAWVDSVVTAQELGDAVASHTYSPPTANAEAVSDAAELDGTAREIGDDGTRSLPSQLSAPTVPSVVPGDVPLAAQLLPPQRRRHHDEQPLPLPKSRAGVEPADTLTPSSYATRPSAIDTGQNQHVERPSAAYPTASPPSPPSLIITNGGVYHPVQAAVSRNAHSLTSAPETQSREAAEEGATPQTRRRRRLYEPHASLDEPLSSARTAALPSRTQIPVPARVRSTRVPLPRDSSVAPSSSTAGSALHRPTAASLARREAAKLEAATRLHEVSSSTAWWERTSSSGWRHAAPIGGSSPNRSPQRASQPGHANSIAKTRHEPARVELPGRRLRLQRKGDVPSAADAVPFGERDCAGGFEGDSRYSRRTVPSEHAAPSPALVPRAPSPAACSADFVVASKAAAPRAVSGPAAVSEAAPGATEEPPNDDMDVEARASRLGRLLLRVKIEQLRRYLEENRGKADAATTGEAQERLRVLLKQEALAAAPRAPSPVSPGRRSPHLVGPASFGIAPRSSPISHSPEDQEEWWPSPNRRTSRADGGLAWIAGTDYANPPKVRRNV